jgi:putative membrane protein
VIGGAAGATAMVVFNHLLAATGYGATDRGRHDQQHRQAAEPNDTDGTISDEPASIKVGAGVIERRTGNRLPEAERRAMGAIAHHVFGASVGGLYGGLSARTPVITLGAGLPYGAFLWAAAAETGLPLAGLAHRPDTYPVERHVASLATHLVFGVTLEGVRRLLMTAWRSRR